MRNVRILASAQALTACGTMTTVLLGGILGASMAPSPNLATLAPSLGILGLACTTVPAALLMQRFGRKRMLMAAALFAAGAACVSAVGVAHGSFLLLCLGCFGVGMHNAFVQQYRFAAVEYVPAPQAGRAVSTLMVGTLGAAILSREAALLTQDLWPGHRYAGSFLGLAGLFLVAIAILSRLPDTMPRHAATADDGIPARSLREVAAQPLFRIAVAGSLVSYAAMSFIMTATPVSMHSVDHHDITDTTFVIQSHLLAMYLPALFSGWVLEQLGVRRMMLLGIAVMAGCIAVATLAGHAVIHYWWAMVLLGVGWNWLFIASTTLLTTTYRPPERFKAQALNDFATFGVQASGSLLAATALFGIGWERLNLVPLPLLVVMFAVAWRLRLPADRPAGA